MGLLDFIKKFVRIKTKEGSVPLQLRDGDIKMLNDYEMKARYIMGTDPIPGCRTKCNEPINNAEYDICQKCRIEQMDYWKDVQSELNN